MKKVLMIGLVLILGLAILVGCQQPTPTPAPTKPHVTKAPASPSPATTEAAAPAEELTYVKKPELKVAEKEKATEADYKPMVDNKAPEGTRTVEVTIPKDAAMPADKELEVGLFEKGKDAALDTKTVATKDAATKDTKLVLGKDVVLPPAEYYVEVKEKDSGKKNVYPFTVGTPAAGGPVVTPPGHFTR